MRSAASQRSRQACAIASAPRSTTSSRSACPACRSIEVDYDVHPGWSEDISSARTWEELPRNAQNYVLFLEEQLGVRIREVSVGPDREQMIDRDAKSGAPA